MTFALLRALSIALSFSSLSLASLSDPIHALGSIYGLLQRQSYTEDPCAGIGNLDYTVPSKVIACLNSFPFDETIRDNIVSVVSKSLDFHTSTNYQIQAPPPFFDVHVDIQAELQRISKRQYESDYALHKDVSAQLKRLFDGHCVYINYCYDALYVSYLPFPLVRLNTGFQNSWQDVYIAPEAFEVISKEFGSFVDEWQQMAGYNFTKYAGARVLFINNLPPSYSISQSAHKAGGYQSRATRENSFFASYIRASTEWSYRMGDFAARYLPPTDDYVTMTVVPVNSTSFETIRVPFASKRMVGGFNGKEELWDKNCKATAATNGVDYFPAYSATMRSREIELVDPSPPRFAEPIAPEDRKHSISQFVDLTAFTDISLPAELQPPEPISGSGTAQFYTLPIVDSTSKVGILSLGSFSTGAGYSAWFDILKTGLQKLKSEGAEYLVVDVTNNGGGYICVAHFLHRILVGKKSTTFPQAGFDTTARYNTLASNITQRIVEGDVPEREFLLYDPVNWKWANSSGYFPESLNWLEPPEKKVINGRRDAFSQKLGDECQPFPVEVPEEALWVPEKIGMVGNGRCASSCAIFTITMSKLEGVRTAVYGGTQYTTQQYAGTVGGQSTSFKVIDSEIKSTKLKDHPDAMPDFIGNMYQGITWRLGFGVKGDIMEEWADHSADLNVPLTREVVNRPKEIWKEMVRRWWPEVQMA